MEIARKNLTTEYRQSWFDKVATVLESNIRGVQIGIYTVAFCGLGIALRSVRPFKKFTSPRQIPDTFFESNIKLNGKILSIDITKKPLLLVDHYPVLFSKLRTIGPPLPVEIEGINISRNGLSWLQTIAKGENIEFILLKKNSDSVSSIVMLKNRDIAKHLVTIGFATVSPFNLELKSLKLFSNYYADLLKAEERAEKRGAGMWWKAQNQFKLSEVFMKFLQGLVRRRPSLLMIKTQ
ncbi:hypothetical protein O3M35_010034 [Rhynocoris fuscipes]|uniref:TNase-like domain-containing protein n=1 Tax=Rhynocoris fuscipes TaxID=488301 RepID=A0AAW1D0M9_9HEMI